MHFTTPKRQSFPSVFTPRPAQPAPPSDAKTFSSTGSMGITWVPGGINNMSPGKTASHRNPEGHHASPQVSPTETKKRSHHLFSALLSALFAAASFMQSRKARRSNVIRTCREPGDHCFYNRTPPPRSSVQPLFPAENPPSRDQKEYAAAFIRRGASSLN